MIVDTLLAVNQLANEGHEVSQYLMNYHWSSREMALKGVLVLYLATKAMEKMPNLMLGSAEDIVEITITGKWDDALWHYFPETMAELTKEKENNG